MLIDIKEIMNILYLCNVNFYEINIDSDNNELIIDLDELIENIDHDELNNKLLEIFDDDEIEINDDNIIIYF